MSDDIDRQPDLTAPFPEFSEGSPGRWGAVSDGEQFERDFPELAAARRELADQGWRPRTAYEMARERGFVLLMAPLADQADPQRLTCPVCGLTWQALLEPAGDPIRPFAACPFGCNVCRVARDATDDEILATLRGATKPINAHKKETEDDE